MPMNVDQGLCEGCGVCVDVCPNNAISLQEGKAWINQTECSSCQLCADVCPTGALQLESIVIPAPEEKPQAIQISRPQTAGAALTGRSDWGKTALVLASQYVLPRLVEDLAAYLERRLSPPFQERASMEINPVGNRPYQRRRQRRGRYL